MIFPLGTENTLTISAVLTKTIRTIIDHLMTSQTVDTHS